MIVAPNWLSRELRRGISINRRLTGFKRQSLHPKIDFCIAVGRFQTYMTKPCTDNIDFHAGLQQMRQALWDEKAGAGKAGRAVPGSRDGSAKGSKKTGGGDA